MPLVVGCNYYLGPDALRGCHNDALGIRRTLSEKFRFDSRSIKIMLDTLENREIPTAAKIRSELNSMINQTQPGDVLFFYFAGHGIESNHPKYHKKFEAIVASDNNLLTSFDFRDMIDRVPKGVSFTITTDP